MHVEIFITGLAAAILIFLVEVELRKMRHFVAPIIFRKSHQSVPVNSERFRNGSEKIGLGDNFNPP